VELTTGRDLLVLALLIGSVLAMMLMLKATRRSSR
jgi:hypothetical protein